VAHAIGSVNSLADLLTQIRSACTSNGWTLSGDVLHKGGIYIRTREVSGNLEFVGGTGIDGDNLLTGAGPSVKRIGQLYSAAQALTFPMTYEVHINTDPDEVYVVVSFSVDFYLWAAWGRSDVAGLPGTGVWYGASKNALNAGAIAMTPTSGGGGTFGNGDSCPGLFYRSNSAGEGAQIETHIHDDLDSSGWSQGAVTTMAYAPPNVGELLNVLPNTLNDETVLVPILVTTPRTSGNKVSIVADLKHARYCRVDYHDPGDIVTLGSDRWRIYPWYQKNLVGRNGGGGIAHTGTLGWAVRYTGP